ncbi:hypothetical protein Tco_1475593 [Tanacetum coccineum]
MSTMTENAIVARAENRLERSQYDSWQSLEVPATPSTHASIRDKTLVDLTPKEKIRKACNIRATNIILHGLLPDVYTLVNHHTVAKEIWDRVKFLIEGSELSMQEGESKLYNEFSRFTSEKEETIHSYYLRFSKLINDMNTIGMTMQKHQFLPTDDPIESLNKEMTFLSTAITLRYPQTNNQLKTLSNPENQATIQDGRVTVQNVGKVDSGLNAQALTTTVIFHTDDIDAFDSDYDGMLTTSVVFMENLCAYDLDVLCEVPNHDTYQDNNVIDQSVQEMRYSEQPVFVDDSNTNITSDTNVISYDQYMKENKSEVVQDTTSSKQQDAMIIGSALAEKHVAISLIDIEETLMLAEDCRIKMKEKQNDLIVKEKKVNIAPIDYASLHKLYEHFVPQKQLFIEQAFWLPIFKTVSKTPPAQPEIVQNNLP